MCRSAVACLPQGGCNIRGDMQKGCNSKTVQLRFVWRQTQHHMQQVIDKARANHNTVDRALASLNVMRAEDGVGLLFLNGLFHSLAAVRILHMTRLPRLVV